MYKVTSKNVHSTLEYPQFDSLVKLIEYGYKNFNESIIIFSENKPTNILLKIYLDEYTMEIDENVKFPMIVINEKWEILKELNIEDLTIDLTIQLKDIKEKIIQNK